jgi:hypothetical protein
MESKPEPYYDKFGNVIPDDHFENEPSYAAVSPEMEKWLDAETDRLLALIERNAA